MHVCVCVGGCVIYGKWVSVHTQIRAELMAQSHTRHKACGMLGGGGGEGNLSYSRVREHEM